MKKIFLFSALLLLASKPEVSLAQNNGEETFKSVCAACHTINNGRLVGPDLSGIYLIRNSDWLIRFIRSSRQFIKSGDTTALAIYEEYNKIPMPDNNLTDAQILEIIEYIKLIDKSATTTSSGSKASDSLAAAITESKLQSDSTAMSYTTETISEGRALFNGHKRFTNGASPCIVCHNINDQTIMGGGRLSLDLTGAYIKLGPAGIKAIVENPPFPVMKTALLKHDIKEDEIQSIQSLLKSIGEQKYNYQIPGSAGLFFFSMGFVCALILLVHLYIFYGNRKIT